MRFGWLLALAACGGTEVERPRTFGGDRPVDLEVPASFEDGKTYPLLLVLHGYSFTGFVQQAYLGIGQLTERSDAFVLAPDGVPDAENKPFWNADPVCCDFDGAMPDDIGYLSALLQAVIETWPIDRDAIFAVGHANGGHMAYRMGCVRADLLSAIVVIAGATGIEVDECRPSEPVSVLHMHGTADLEFNFEGGGPFQMSPGAPGPVESVSRWATYDGCDATRTAIGEPIDLDSVVDGPETTREAFGCPSPISVELWTMGGSEHVPGLTDTFVPTVWPWLLDHAR
jgi:polyhydroxybutyrate depolymerase